MGVGVVARDYRGDIIGALCRRLESCPDPVHAESMGAVMAAEFCRDLGLQDVVLEGDSLLVVKALKCERPNWSPYGQTIEDARGLLFTRRNWMVQHVKREANLAAHSLAKFALSTLRRWFGWRIAHHVFFLLFL
jgi:ribonuclease HI